MMIVNLRPHDQLTFDNHHVFMAGGALVAPWFLDSPILTPKVSVGRQEVHQDG